ncbi:hypothetical protein CEXT_119411 [Caerostris extrusa]|uniref:Uncharacterized protein n=1 Tax=Caerostris extrusa TaxID=172846 RepID=A0AAV4N821_CAEEX|nr:hypothetical protein CEXT_119411 [Caerostris extrusa]
MIYSEKIWPGSRGPKPKSVTERNTPPEKAELITKTASVKENGRKDRKRHFFYIGLIIKKKRCGPAMIDVERRTGIYFKNIKKQQPRSERET